MLFILSWQKFMDGIYWAKNYTQSNSMNAIDWNIKFYFIELAIGCRMLKLEVSDGIVAAFITATQLGLEKSKRKHFYSQMMES